MDKFRFGGSINVVNKGSGAKPTGPAWGVVILDTRSVFIPSYGHGYQDTTEIINDNDFVWFPEDKKQEYETFLRFLSDGQKIFVAFHIDCTVSMQKTVVYSLTKGE